MNLEFIKPQILGSLLIKSSQSNFNLRSPGPYLLRSYLITTVIGQQNSDQNSWRILYKFCGHLILKRNPYSLDFLRILWASNFLNGVLEFWRIPYSFEWLDTKVGQQKSDQNSWIILLTSKNPRTIPQSS